jgi:hypothetical protein
MAKKDRISEIPPTTPGGSPPDGRIQIQTGQTDKKEDVGDVGIAQGRQYPMPQPHLLLLYDSPRGPQNLLFFPDQNLFPLRLGKKMVHIRRDIIDDPLLQSLFCCDGFAFPNGLFDPILASLPFLRYPRT